MNFSLPIIWMTFNQRQEIDKKYSIPSMQIRNQMWTVSLSALYEVHFMNRHNKVIKTRRIKHSRAKLRESHSTLSLIVLEGTNRTQSVQLWVEAAFVKTWASQAFTSWTLVLSNRHFPVDRSYLTLCLWLHAWSYFRMTLNDDRITFHI